MHHKICNTKINGYWNLHHSLCFSSLPSAAARMVPHLCPAVTKVGCLKHLAQQQVRLQYLTPSSTPSAPQRVEPTCIGDILDRIMNIVVVTTNQHQMVRSLAITQCVLSY